MKPKRTLIAIPCMDQVAAPFAQSLATLTKEGECFISMIIASLVYESRNNLAQQALALDCDYIMWFDSDMIFQPDVLQRMLRHMEDGKDMVTGIYYRRRQPYSPVLFSKLEIDGVKSVWEPYNDIPEEGLFEVEGCGFGCVCMKTDFLMDIGAEEGAAWFTPMAGFGEDLSFCYRARKHGVKIWADPEIQLGHVGQVIVDQHVYKTTKDMIEAQKNAGNS